MKVAGVLQQKKRLLIGEARARDAEIERKGESLIGLLDVFDWMDTKNPAGEKLANVDDVITRINAQVDELRKAIRKSFFLDEDVPMEIAMERNCAELLEAISSAAGDAYKKAQKQMDEFGSRDSDGKVPSSYEFIVAFDMAKSFAASLEALCLSGGVDRQSVTRILQIVNDTKAIPDLKLDSYYASGAGMSCYDTEEIRDDLRSIMRGLASVGTLCSGLKIVLMNKI